jgi:hypothetical protein
MPGLWTASITSNRDRASGEAMSGIGMMFLGMIAGCALGISFTVNAISRNVQEIHDQCVVSHHQPT